VCLVAVHASESRYYSTTTQPLIFKKPVKEGLLTDLRPAPQDPAVFHGVVKVFSSTAFEQRHATTQSAQARHQSAKHVINHIITAELDYN
jgi:hypothetical protein